MEIPNSIFKMPSLANRLSKTFPLEKGQIITERNQILISSSAYFLQGYLSKDILSVVGAILEHILKGSAP